MHYDISFPNLGIYLEHVGKSIDIFGFEIAYYGIIIGCAILIGFLIAAHEAKITRQNPEDYLDMGIIGVICGIVGARLYYPDNTIQHAGIVVGMGGCAGSMFVGMDRRRTGYFHKAAIVQDMSAVTAACMMIKREAFEAAGGFEEKLAVAFNDVDFCLKVRREGFLVVYNPDVEMYHYESKTRGYEDTPEKERRFQSEIEYMRSHWLDILKKGDPYYNPNLSLKVCDYSIKPHKNTIT